MEVSDRYKKSLNEILKIIPKQYFKKGTTSVRLYKLISSGLKFYDSTNNKNMILSVLTGKNMIYKRAGRYFPHTIQQHVRDNMKRQLHYTYYFPNEKKLDIFIGLMDDNIIDYQKYHEMMRLIISWIHIALKYSNEECSKKHEIYFYMTDFYKTLPQNEIVVLGEKNINSALTTRCSVYGNETIIYRKEEWFKVFIHEMMHAYGFDISPNYKDLIGTHIEKMFSIKTKMEIAEGYVETWARIINGAYAAYLFSEGQDDFEELFLFTMEVERIFSVIQAQKVLMYMNLTYTEILTKGSRVAEHLYREKTHAFCYYILTAALMNDPYNFMNFCSKTNNKWFKFDNTVKSIYDLTEYIKNACIDPVFMENMNMSFNIKSKGLRMSLIDVN